MKKTIIIASLIIFISENILAQTKYYKKYLIKNVGSINIPSTMELQSGNYKKNSEKYMKELSNQYDFEISSNRIVFQQKGLNNYNRSSFNRYARVIIETKFGNFNDFEKLDFNISKFSTIDIQELDQTFKKGILNSFYNTPIKLIKWYKLKVEKINGMSCFHIKYKRQYANNPFVIVNVYLFQNNDRMHKLTMSYRLSEESYWKTDFYKILKSFRIKKR